MWFWDHGVPRILTNPSENRIQLEKQGKVALKVVRGRTMPKEMERELKSTAKRKFPGSKKRQNAYVYGTMRKTGWTPDQNAGWDHSKKRYT